MIFTENIIKQLINIENRAQSVMKNTNDLEINFDKIVSDGIADIQRDINEKMEKRIECIDSFERDDADKKIEKIYEKLAVETEHLKQRSEEKRSEWADKIFNEIVGI